MYDYAYQKQNVNLDILTELINSSAISQNVLYMDYHSPDTLVIHFEEELIEQDVVLLNNIISAHNPGNQIPRISRYKVVTNPNKITLIQWFENDLGGGSYSSLAQEEIWTYSSGKLSRITTKYYGTDDVQYRQDIVDYKTIDSNRVVEKPVRS